MDCSSDSRYGQFYGETSRHAEMLSVGLAHGRRMFSEVPLDYHDQIVGPDRRNVVVPELVFQVIFTRFIQD